MSTARITFQLRTQEHLQAVSILRFVLLEYHNGHCRGSGSKDSRSYAARLDALQQAGPAATPATSLPVQPQTVMAIQVIIKPKGEAGNMKSGYQLQDAMMMDDKDYAVFRDTVRLNAARAGIRLDHTFRQQDRDAVDNLCKLCVNQIPYLTKKRFPNYWPVTEYLKSYLSNARVYRKKRQAEAEDSSSGGDD